MKKTIKFIFSAILIGGLISLYYYSKLKEQIDVKVVSIFQTGVYTTYEQATSMTDSKSKIFYDGKLYHVYDALVVEPRAKEKLVNYYKQNNIDYYIKQKYIDKNLYKNLDEYSKLIELSDDDTLKIINKTILDKYGDDVI